MSTRLYRNRLVALIATLTLIVGLCAYSAVDRAPGPGWIGVAILVVTTLVAAGGKSTLIGWPLVLGAGAGTLLVVGLRPSRPLPPAPSRGDAAQVYEIRDER